MTSQGNGPPLVYAVYLSGFAPDQVKSQLQRAIISGKEKRFLEALRAIIDKLRSQPRSFGEPLYRLSALKLTVYHGAIGPVVVDYGVHDERPLVFIRGVRYLE